MDNRKILKQGIELLKEVNPDELEVVQINHTKYDDDSVSLSVEVSWPRESKESFYDGEEFRPEISK